MSAGTGTGTGAGKRVLVTGGAGYLGSVLVPYLLRRHYRVRVLDRFSSPAPSLLSLVDHEGFEPVKGDVRDQETLKKCLQGVDFVIPLAAIVGAPACQANPADTWSINYHAITILSVLIKGTDTRVIFPNSNSSYGKTPEGEVSTEESPLNPLSSYARSKQEAERAVLGILEKQAIAFRLATAFGPSPRMRLDLLVNDFTYRAVKDKALFLYEPKFRRNFIHVYDLARLFTFGMENFDRLKGQVYNAGMVYGLTKLELAETIQKYVPDLSICQLEGQKDPDQRDYCISVAKLEKAGFTTAVSLERGIRELLKTYSMFPVERFRNA